MRPSRRTIVAVAATFALAACADSPVAPAARELSVVDRLNAVADSLGTSNPLAGFIRFGAFLAARVPRAQSVTIDVDGVPTSFQALAVESVLPGTLTGGDIDSRILFAWDATMRHFVGIDVVSSSSATGYNGATGVYGERLARGELSRAYVGDAHATGTRARTGAACAARPGDAQIVTSCVEASFDFAFALDASPIDPALFNLGAVSGAGGVAHTLRMSSARVPGAFLTMRPIASLGARVASTDR